MAAKEEGITRTCHPCYVVIEDDHVVCFASPTRSRLFSHVYSLPKLLRPFPSRAIQAPCFTPPKVSYKT